MSTAASAPKPRTRSAQAPETEASDRCQDNRRPLWDAVLILLSIGGIAGSATSLVPTCRRLRRHCRSRFARAGAPVPARAAQVDAALTTSQMRSFDTQ
jgi:hypothetical protein